MFEKVNPEHPDKVADRIAGAIVDLAYKNTKDPRVAVEVLLGHGRCLILIESSYNYSKSDIKNIVTRIAGKVKVDCVVVPQDNHLADNQLKEFRCGDNGIFKGTVVSKEQVKLATIANVIYNKYKTDGKYIIDNDTLIICQSNANNDDLVKDFSNAIINPIGAWTGGIDVDSGATNRKLGSDMGDSVTGGGLHGKDLTKADVSVNIVAWLLAQEANCTVEAFCAIGDKEILFKFNNTRNDTYLMPYALVVEKAREYIQQIGGFEKFAEWGLIR